MDTKWVLMTNDDGIDAPGFELLVKAMNKAGIPLVAFAPSGNKSACSMQLNLGKPIDLHNRNELIQQWDLDESVGVHLFALDGTPCDTDNEWTFVEDASDGTYTGYISHQRADNSRFQWNYNKGVNTGTDNDVTGTLWKRTELGTGGTQVLFQ